MARPCTVTAPAQSGTPTAGMGDQNGGRSLCYHNYEVEWEGQSGREIRLCMVVRQTGGRGSADGRANEGSQDDRKKRRGRAEIRPRRRRCPHKERQGRARSSRSRIIVPQLAHYITIRAYGTWHTVWHKVWHSATHLQRSLDFSQRLWKSTLGRHSCRCMCLRRNFSLTRRKARLQPSPITSIFTGGIHQQSLFYRQIIDLQNDTAPVLPDVYRVMHMSAVLDPPSVQEIGRSLFRS
jgi:hypothetical protein